MKTAKRPKSAQKVKKSNKKGKSKPVLVAFLLDRSASMNACRDETISGFNAYLGKIQKENGASGMKFTLTQFDSIGIDITYDAVPIKSVKKLNTASYAPRASTPLYDAIGKTVRSIEEFENDYNILFVTLTDGQENCSCKWSIDAIQSLIKKKENAGWTFAHIGVGVEGFAATQTYSIGTQSASNVLRSEVRDSKGRFDGLAAVTVNYCAAAGAAGPSGMSGPMGDVWTGKSLGSKVKCHAKKAKK